eukprot:g28233.t1
MERRRGGGQENEELTHLSRAAHFGERSLLRGESAAPVNIDAGPEGMTCLTFWGDNIASLLKKETSMAPSGFGDIKEWWTRKARGFKSREDVLNRRPEEITAEAKPMCNIICWEI